MSRSREPITGTIRLVRLREGDPTKQEVRRNAGRIVVQMLLTDAGSDLMLTGGDIDGVRIHCGRIGYVVE